jgi:hypothetical protein
VRDVGFLDGGDLLGCQLHGNRCERVIEVVQLSADYSEDVGPGRLSVIGDDRRHGPERRAARVIPAQ